MKFLNRASHFAKNIILRKVETKRMQNIVLASLSLSLATVWCNSNPCLAQSAQNHYLDTRKYDNFSVPEPFKITSYRQHRTSDIDPVTHRQMLGHFLGPVIQSKGMFSKESGLYHPPSRVQPQFSPWNSQNPRPPYRMEGTSANQQRELQDFLDWKSDWFAGYDCETNF